MRLVFRNLRFEIEKYIFTSIFHFFPHIYVYCPSPARTFTSNERRAPSSLKIANKRFERNRQLNFELCFHPIFEA